MKMLRLMVRMSLVAAVVMLGLGNMNILMGVVAGRESELVPAINPSVPSSKGRKKYKI